MRELPMRRDTRGKFELSSYGAILLVRLACFEKRYNDWPGLARILRVREVVWIALPMLTHYKFSIESSC